jgi:calpain-7
MKATKVASTDSDKTRLRGKCEQLLSKAEEIKKSQLWVPKKKDVSLKAPVSQRAVTQKEERILLEGSKLHGFKFPPWIMEPKESEFGDAGSSLYT